MVAAQVVSAPLNGLLADRKGNKATIVLASCAMLVATLWALLAPSLAWFTVVFVFVGFNLTGDLMGRYNISVEYGPPMKRSTYIGLMNTILAPFYFASVAGGWISETFGYEAMFLAGATASVIGISLMMLKVVDPRSIHPNPS
jgi:MFS family permease